MKRIRRMTYRTPEEIAEDQKIRKQIAKDLPELLARHQQQMEDNMGNYLKKKPNGEPLENEKSPDIAAFCDEELKELPAFETIPHGLVLVSVVDNGPFEAALVCDTEYDLNRVKRSIESGDPRPVRFFLVKREWARQMAEHPLESDQ